jgi:NADH:ubiquinone oxidoreductase subunit H
MHFKKIFMLIALTLAVGFFGCTERKVEAPTQERITKNLVPPKAEVEGENFLI